MTKKELGDYVLQLAETELEQFGIENKWAYYYSRKGDHKQAKINRDRAVVHHAKYVAYHNCYVLTLETG